MDPADPQAHQQDEAAAADGADGTVDQDPTDPGMRTRAPAEREPVGEHATTVIADDDAELRECPNCDAPNSSRRRTCGRCGADLVTGEVRSQSSGYSTPAGPVGGESAERLDPERPRTGRIVALVVVVGVLLGALIGGLIALDTGPFSGNGGSQETLPEAPPFDPARYEDDPGALTIVAIGTTTTHEPLGDESYDAAQMVDRDLGTAWNNDGGRNTSGVGEVIAVEFDGPVWISEVVLGNGSQAGDAEFLGNARVERARLRLDGGVVFEVNFLDQQGLQVVELPEPVLTTGAMVDVLAAFNGDTYEDLALAELRFVGWPADGADRELAESRSDSD